MCSHTCAIVFSANRSSHWTTAGRVNHNLQTRPQGVLFGIDTHKYRHRPRDTHMQTHRDLRDPLVLAPWILWVRDLVGPSQLFNKINSELWWWRHTADWLLYLIIFLCLPFYPLIHVWKWWESEFPPDTLYCFCFIWSAAQLHNKSCLMTVNIQSHSRPNTHCRLIIKQKELDIVQHIIDN